MNSASANVSDFGMGGYELLTLPSPIYTLPVFAVGQMMYTPFVKFDASVSGTGVVPRVK